MAKNHKFKPGHNERKVSSLAMASQRRACSKDQQGVPFPHASGKLMASQLAVAIKKAKGKARSSIEPRIQGKQSSPWRAIASPSELR